MSCKTSNSSIVDVDKYKNYETVPYLVARNVLKQDELEEVAGYDRHKDTRKIEIIFSQNFILLNLLFS